MSWWHDWGDFELYLLGMFSNNSIHKRYGLIPTATLEQGRKSSSCNTVSKQLLTYLTVALFLLFKSLCNLSIAHYLLNLSELSMFLVVFPLTLSSLDRFALFNFFVSHLPPQFRHSPSQPLWQSPSYFPSRLMSHSLSPFVHCRPQYLLFVQEGSRLLLAIHSHHQVLYMTDTAWNACLFGFFTSSFLHTGQILLEAAAFRCIFAS